MRNLTILLVCVLSLLGSAALAQVEDTQGELPFPEDPITISVPLPDRACRGVHATGQTECWDADGNPINCAGTGCDGDYQMGITMWDGGSRFADNFDGTVTDNLTGLIWLQNANCFGRREWAHALSAANTLTDGSCGLTDGSVAGDWRLPNVKELLSLINFGQHSPALALGHPFFYVRNDHYWSSTSYEYLHHWAWEVSVGTGFVRQSLKGDDYYVWPVRGRR